MRILLVEDDAQLASVLRTALRDDGYTANHVDTAKDALLAIRAQECDMVILDLGLPDMDGIEVLKEIRRARNTLPVLIMTARDSLDDRVTGLDNGADDYLVKPFFMSEMLARLRVIERRLGTALTSVIEVGKVAMDTASHTVESDGQGVELSRKEFMVLRSLMEHAGRIQTRDQLESKLYEWGEEVASNAVEVHIHHLRKKLPKDFIKTIRGVGYTLAKA